MLRTVLLLFSALSRCFAGDTAGGGSQDALFGALPVVEAAALHAQNLQEAPANVTIVTAADIRRYGYRTLGEVLESVRGFYGSYDRIYHYAGVSGFSLPGDYNTRFLVMINGHPMTGAVYNANGNFGQDFGLDLDLVSRIEIIRGPTSALYGSNGILANINIVTRSPVDAERLRVSTETASYGENKIAASGGIYLGGGANLLVSGSIFHTSGSPLHFPDSPAAVTGTDWEKGYHTFANLVWHNWSFTGYFNNRVKNPPVPWGAGAEFYDPGQRVRDARNFVAATYTRDIGGGGLRWQIYFDQYKYDDRFDYPRDDGGVTDVRSTARGESLGTQLSWQREWAPGELTIGGTFAGEIRNLQQDHDAYPDVTYSPAIEHPDVTGGVFAQQQWKLPRGVTLYGGLRMDVSRNYGATASPRLALVYQQGADTTWKLVYGRPFRNPSAFESYYTDGGKAFLPNPALRPETAQTFEASMERKLSPGLSLIAAAYDYRLNNVIRQTLNDDFVSIYENLGRIHSQGLQLELNQHTDRFEANGSYAFERARDAGAAPANMPGHIAKGRAAAALAGTWLWVSGSFEYLSARQTMAGDTVRPVALAGVTLSTRKLHPNFDLLAGIRNLAGWRYQDPIGLGSDTMPQNGRSWFVKLIYHARE